MTQMCLPDRQETEETSSHGVHVVMEVDELLDDGSHTNGFQVRMASVNSKRAPFDARQIFLEN